MKREYIDAIVKNIPDGTVVDDEHHDAFAMTDMIGEQVKVFVYEEYGKNWYRVEGDDMEYNYHRSWLTFKRTKS